MDACVTYCETEIRRAISFYILRVCDLRNYAIALLSLMLIILICAFLFDLYAALCLAFFLLLAYVLYYLYYQRPIQSYLKYYRSRGDVAYRFTEERLFASHEDAKSACSWSSFKQAYEIPSAFLLIDGNRFVYIIPKSAFYDADMVQQVRELLSATFPKFKKYNVRGDF